MKRESRTLLIRFEKGVACLLVVRGCKLIDWGWCGDADNAVESFLNSSVRFEVRYYTVCGDDAEEFSSVLEKRGYLRLPRFSCKPLLCALAASMLEELRALKPVWDER